MKLLSIKISSVILAVLVLFSTFSFAIEKHYCGDFLVDVSYLGEADKCNDASDVTNKGCDSKITIKKCCKNEVQIIDGQDEIQKVSFRVWISAGIESQKTFNLARGKAFCLPLFFSVLKSNQNDLTDLVNIHKTFG